jgi:hypothetical protein
MCSRVGGSRRTVFGLIHGVNLSNRRRKQMVALQTLRCFAAGVYLTQLPIPARGPLNLVVLVLALWAPHSMAPHACMHQHSGSHRVKTTVCIPVQISVLAARLRGACFFSACAAAGGKSRISCLYGEGNHRSAQSALFPSPPVLYLKLPLNPKTRSPSLPISVISQCLCPVARPMRSGYERRDMTPCTED